jgi:hypothetical protein
MGERVCKAHIFLELGSVSEVKTNAKAIKELPPPSTSRSLILNKVTKRSPKGWKPSQFHAPKSYITIYLRNPGGL